MSHGLRYEGRIPAEVFKMHAHTDIDRALARLVVDRMLGRSA